MKKEVILLLGIIIISGCTSEGGSTSKPTTSKGDYGLLIDEFSTDMATIEEGDTATLLLSFTNVDGESAKDIYGKVYAVGLTGTSTSYTIKEVEANNSDFFEFDLKAPSGLNIDRTYTPYAALCYNYKNRGSTSIFVVDQDVYSVGNVPALSSESTPGPVQVELSFSKDVQKIEVGNPRETTLSIDLTNVDDGKVINGSSGMEGEDHALPPGSLLITIPKTTGAKITITDLRETFSCATDKDNIVLTSAKGNGTVINESSGAYCKNYQEISFGSSGSGRTLRLGLTFNVTAGIQDIAFFMGELTYRYCIQTDPISIQATKIS